MIVIDYDIFCLHLPAMNVLRTCKEGRALAMLAIIALESKKCAHFFLTKLKVKVKLKQMIDCYAIYLQKDE